MNHNNQPKSPATNQDKEMNEVNPIQDNEPKKSKIVRTITQRIKESGYDAAQDFLTSQPSINRAQLYHMVPSLQRNLRSGLSNLGNSMRQANDQEELNVLSTLR